MKLSNILPEDINETAVDSPSRNDPAGDSILAHYTQTRSVSETAAVDIAVNHIDRLDEQLAVPDVMRSMACDLFEQYFSSDEGEIVLIELYAAASLYCAGKVTEEPVDPTQISEAGGDLLTEARLLRRVKQIASGLGLDPSSFIGSTQFVPRYCDELGLPDSVDERAQEIIESCQSSGISSGKSPSGWAAAAVYNAVLESESKVTQADIAEVANVTEVTIRNRYKEQRNFLAEEA